MSQTSYSRNMDKAIAGTIYDLSPRRIDSYAVETGTIYPGMGVILGTDPETQVKLPSATTAVCAGIVLLQAKEQNDDGTVTYVAEDTVPVLDKGRAWVTTTSAVTAGEAAYLTFSGDDIGKWTNSTNASTTASAITGAKFKTTLSAAGIAVVELN